MAMGCTGAARCGSRETLRKVVERNCDSLPNVLVVGRDATLRESVARMFHDASFRDSGVFTVLRCANRSRGAESEFLNLFFALTRDVWCHGSRETELLSGGTLFIDEVQQMDPREQRICLEFLKQLQRLKNERPDQVEVRVVAGMSSDPSETTRDVLLPGLLDLLDKVRVELDSARDAKPGPQLVKGELLGV